jgi:hypothetical protein
MAWRAGISGVTRRPAGLRCFNVAGLFGDRNTLAIVPSHRFRAILEWTWINTVRPGENQFFLIYFPAAIDPSQRHVIGDTGAQASPS